MSKRAILPSLCASVLLLASVPLSAAEPAAKPAEKPAVTNAPVSVFKDKKLEAAVRRQVFAKRESQDPLTAADVATVSTVSAPFSGITSLAGLEHCVALASLEIPGNQIIDLVPLAGLKQLQYLNLASNQVSVIAPLASVPALDRASMASRLAAVTAGSRRERRTGAATERVEARDTALSEGAALERAAILLVGRVRMSVKGR